MAVEDIAVAEAVLDKFQRPDENSEIWAVLAEEFCRSMKME